MKGMNDTAKTVLGTLHHQLKGLGLYLKPFLYSANYTDIFV